MSMLTKRNSDPASVVGYPATFPLEVALKTAPISKICAAYGVDQDEWDRLRVDPAFVAAVKHYHEELKKEGMSFKLKAQLQAEELLTTSWKLIHAPNDEVPPSVKADLLKFTVRAAGFDGSKDKDAGPAAPTFQIQINL